jgi:hypothetical protein
MVKLSREKSELTFFLCYVPNSMLITFMVLYEKDGKLFTLKCNVSAGICACRLGSTSRDYIYPFYDQPLEKY